MGRNLNELIDGLFKGVVFVIFDFVRTLFYLLIRPFKGALKIERKLRRHRADQVRPTVFLFLSISLLQTLPILLLPVMTDTGSANGTGGAMMDKFSQVLRAAVDQKTWSSVAADVIVAVTAGVSLLYLCAHVLGVVFLRSRARRELLADCAFYQGGLQIAYVAIGFFAAFYAISLIFSPHATTAGMAIGALVFVGAMVLALLSPVSMAAALLKRGRDMRIGDRPASASRAFRIARLFLLVVLLDVSVGMSTAATVTIFIEVQPLDKSRYDAKLLSCEIRKSAQGYEVNAAILVTVTGDEPQLIENDKRREFSGDPFTLLVSSEQEGPGRALPIRSWQFETLSGDPFSAIVEPGRSAALRMVAGPFFEAQIAQARNPAYRCSLYDGGTMLSMSTLEDNSEFFP